jgi:hypothetical protein
MYNFDKKELTKEKSLWQVFKLSTYISGNYFQQLFILFVFICLYVNAYIFENDILILLKTVREWATIGFNFSITTLGFLITGFAIFVTVSKPTMMLTMMGHYDKKHKMPTLKYVLITFMKVFIGFLVLSFIYILIIIFGKENGFISNFFTYFKLNDCIKFIIIKSTYVLVGTSFIYLLFLLKSFIFNIYSTVMMLLRWECVEIDQQQKINSSNVKISDLLTENRTRKDES